MNPSDILCHASGLTLPQAFLSRMKAMLGEDFEAFCASYARPAHPTLRVNTHKISPDALRELLPYLGNVVPWQKNGIYYPADGEARPGKHPLHEAGAYYIQEASAMLPASLCPPEAGERVLDLCAAPGGKATQLAVSLGGTGLLVANEIHPTRAAVLSQNIERMGIPNALVTSASPAELASRFPAFFDKIVVDAPCSGEGMFRKEADAVTMWSPENVALCAARQADILENAATMLRPGGHLVYSTCTFAPAENEGVLLGFLARHPEFEVVSSVGPDVVAAREAGLLDGGHPEWVEGYEGYPPDLLASIKHTYRVFPHRCEGEGHFAALLRKREAEDAPPVRRDRRKADRRKGERSPANDATAHALFEDFARSVLGGVPACAKDTLPCLLGERLWLIPKALCESAEDFRRLTDGLRILRAGLCVGTVVGLDRGRPRFEPDHALSLALGEGERPSFPVDLTGAQAYLRGEALPADSLRGWHTVTFAGLPLGWGKASDGLMKNHYPKGLRQN